MAQHLKFATVKTTIAMDKSTICKNPNPVLKEKLDALANRTVSISVWESVAAAYCNVGTENPCVSIKSCPKKRPERQVFAAMAWIMIATVKLTSMTMIAAVWLGSLVRVIREKLDVRNNPMVLFSVWELAKLACNDASTMLGGLAKTKYFPDLPNFAAITKTTIATAFSTKKNPHVNAIQAVGLAIVAQAALKM